MIEKFESAFLEEAVRICVVPIGEHLAERRIPMPSRIFGAALIFVEHNVQGMEGDSKDDFLRKSWFRLIFRTIREWHKEKYRAQARRGNVVVTEIDSTYLKAQHRRPTVKGRYTHFLMHLGLHYSGRARRYTKSGSTSVRLVAKRWILSTQPLSIFGRRLA